MAFYKKKKNYTKEERSEHRKQQKEKVQKSRQEIVDIFIADLEKGQIPWKKPWVARGVYMNGGSKRPYRGKNILYLYVAMRRLKEEAEKQGKPFDDDPRFFTFEQIKKMGKSKEFADKPFEERPHVRKGEEAFCVEFSKPHRYNTVEENEDGELEVIGKKAFLTWVYPVFHASQIENLPPMKDLQRFEWDDVERAERIIEANGVKIKHSASDEACYVPGMDEIHMPNKDQFKNSESYYATALHEVIHSTGHKSRMNRDIRNLFGSDDYAFEELVAQTGSAILCSQLGIMTESTFENDQSYIQNWITVLKKDPNVLFRAAGLAQEAVDYLFQKELELAKSQNLPAEKIAEIENCLKKESDYSIEKKSDKDKAKTASNSKDGAER